MTLYGETKPNKIDCAGCIHQGLGECLAGYIPDTWGNCDHKKCGQDGLDYIRSCLSGV